MHQNGYVGRKMRLPKLKEDPAIVIAAFGSTKRAKATLDRFEAELKNKYPDTEIYWAYTSEIIRRKLKLPSVHETLAKVEADGYRKAVVQPLHVFPGTEYQQLVETCSYFPGLRVFPGETLLHRWDFVKEILEGVETDFLSPEEGLNVLAIHGTPLAADPVNIVYLGFERLVADMYPNVITASVEGVPDHEAVFAKAQREGLAKQYRRARIIPMMYFAGLHAEEDLMGDEDSWRGILENMGFEVECLTVRNEDKVSFKGLAYYPEVNEGFLNRLDRALELAKYY
ncbi:MAG: sirohydrochlorin cobaltochelatase [Desulfobacterales bacterium]|nr:sirohydrochlorin cobaltochelatase [Desulfobacterales bacterium]